MRTYVFTINGPTQSVTADCVGSLEEVVETLAKQGYVLGKLRKLGSFNAPTEKNCAILAYTFITVSPL